MIIGVCADGWAHRRTEVVIRTCVRGAVVSPINALAEVRIGEAITGVVRVHAGVVSARQSRVWRDGRETAAVAGGEGVDVVRRPRPYPDGCGRVGFARRGRGGRLFVAKTIWFGWNQDVATALLNRNSLDPTSGCGRGIEHRQLARLLSARRSTDTASTRRPRGQPGAHPPGANEAAHTCSGGTTRRSSGS